MITETDILLLTNSDGGRPALGLGFALSWVALCKQGDWVGVRLGPGVESSAFGFNPALGL